MRRTLALVALATTSMVSLAFVVPLLLIVHRIAADQAFADAKRQADTFVAILAVVSDPVDVKLAFDASAAGKARTGAIHLPGGNVIGQGRAGERELARARATDHAITVDTDGGRIYLRAIPLATAGVAVGEVFVSDESLNSGVLPASAALLAVALGLVAGSVLVADRLAGKVVSATQHLASVARAFGNGNLLARVEPSGPRELAEAGNSFNTMADRVVALLDAERELAADLSHRLRTPLTALRLDAEALDEGPDAARMQEAVNTLEREIDIVIRTARRPLSERGPEWSDLAEVVADRVAFWSALAEDEHRRCRLAGVGRRIPVAVPRAEVVAVVDVLLGNVFRHTAPGTDFAVTVLVMRGNLAALVVEDAGQGIQHPRRAVKRGASGGGSTGLGLDIVRRVAEGAGGTIRIDSSTMGGARIRVDMVMLDPAVLRPQRPRNAGSMWEDDDTGARPWPEVPRGAGAYRAAHRAVGALRAIKPGQVNSRSDRP